MIVCSDFILELCAAWIIMYKRKQIKILENGDPDRNPKAILVLYFRLPVPICMRNSKIHQIIFSR
jgi:hypothetical protein